MTRPAIVLPAGAGVASIVLSPGSPSPQLARGRSGAQRAAGRCLKQLARGRLAGRRLDLGASTWRRRETAAGAPAVAVRWLSRAVLAAPVTGFLPGGQPGNQRLPPGMPRRPDASG